MIYFGATESVRTVLAILASVIRAENIKSGDFVRHRQPIMPEAAKFATHKKGLRDWKFDCYSKDPRKRCGSGSKMPAGKGLKERKC